MLLVFSFLRLSGQGVDTYFGEAPLSFKDRIAIRTNVVDWVLTSPNLAFDYDIVSTAYDKQSVGVGLKYNWNTTHTYIPKRVYNLFDARFDYRFYWRQQPFDNRDNFYGDWEREWINSSKGFDKLRARANCFRAVEKPKPHISLFVGPYLSFSTFSIKLSAAENSKGRQGLAVGAGLTGGVALPLYGYKNGSALDLEFGGSLGWHFASYDFYTVDIENNEYSQTGHRNQFVYFPLVSDARLSLVYRFRSISKQHTEIDYDLIDRRYVARLIELDEEAVEIYNDSIRMLKDELDGRNEEIALYKETVESQPGFNKAFALEYFTPYKYMMSASKKYTRQNKDTLPKIQIDSIDQIVDAVMISVREEIDSIPHVLPAQIDKEFVNQYNNISLADGKKVNRTSLIREIYTRLNGYIEDNNSKLVAGTFSSDVYSEKLNKYNVKTQSRTPVEITYKDSVRTIEMSSNERIEWLNNIKKQAWADMQKRMSSAARANMPVVTYNDMASDSLQADSVMADSLRLDSMRLDSMHVDSIFVGAVLNDSLSTDSVASDSLYRSVKLEAQDKKNAAKAKKTEKAAKPAKTAKAEKAPKAKKSEKAAEPEASETIELPETPAISEAAGTSETSEKSETVETKEQTEPVVTIEEVEGPNKSAKAEKSKKADRPKKSKKGTVESAEGVPGDDNIGTGAIRTDSIMPSVDVDLPEDVQVEASALVTYSDSGYCVLCQRDYFIREEDED